MVLALLDLREAQRNKSKADELYLNNYQYCQLVLEMDPSNAIALNHLANHHFHTWVPIIAQPATIINERMIVFKVRDTYSSSTKIDMGDLLRLNKSFVASVAEKAVYDANTSKVTVILWSPLPSFIYSIETKTVLISHVDIEWRALAESRRLANAAYLSNKMPEIRAESSFIAGRAMHAGGSAVAAKKYYEISIDLWPDMTPAAMYLGQILLSEGKYGEALKTFEQVRSRYPEDKECLAYIALIKDEIVSMEKLRDLCPAFAWGSDLWLLQGYLRLDQEKVSERASALKCLENALLGFEAKNYPLDPNLLSNIAALHHTLGFNLDNALKYIRRAIQTFAKPNQGCLEMIVENQMNNHTTDNTHNDDNVNESKSSDNHSDNITNNSSFKKREILFRCSENAVFYSWSSEFCTVKVITLSSGGSNHINDHLDVEYSRKIRAELMAFEASISQSHDSVSFQNILNIGDDILIGDLQLNVLEVQSNYFIATGLVPLQNNTEYKVKKKVSNHNFNSDTYMFSYNMARILEDMGQVNAAKELYTELNLLDPSFIGCKCLENIYM